MSISNVIYTQKQNFRFKTNVETIKDLKLIYLLKQSRFSMFTKSEVKERKDLKTDLEVTNGSKKLNGASGLSIFNRHFWHWLIHQGPENKHGHRFRCRCRFRWEKNDNENLTVIFQKGNSYCCLKRSVKGLALKSHSKDYVDIHIDLDEMLSSRLA